MKPFGILAWPAYANKNDNPYNFLLYKNIENSGYPIYDFSFSLKGCIKWALSDKYRIFHVHWPNYVLSTSSHFSAWRHLVVFYVFIKIAKIFKKKLVWTVHNLVAHEAIYPDLQAKLERILYNDMDGFISLNAAGVDLIKDKIGDANSQKVIHINHPYYKDYYQNKIDKTEARKNLSIPENKFVVLFIGQIRAYKNVPALIKIFKELNNKNAFLLIAGSVQKGLLNELEELIGDRDDIKLVDRFIKDEDLQLYLNGADLIVTPYDRIFNSGSLFLNLSFNRPTLAPALASIPELQKIVGTRWVHTYEGPFSTAILKESIEKLAGEGETDTTPDLSSFDPELISAQTREFYTSLLESR